MTNQPESAVKDPLIGTIFADRYEIQRLLGRSNMSVVYKALDQTSRASVAIKLLSNMMTDGETLQRFHREAKIARTLMHPNVVALLDHGVTAEGTPFHVLEYIDGETLDDILGVVGNLNPVESVDIFIKMCRGVQYLHSRGIVHRDLKPGNLMIVNNPAQLSVKVIDFGIAKATGVGMHQSVDLTRPGEVLGSLLYTAPERLQGQKGDARSDIYSIGCLMYETLTGKNPFSADTPAEIVDKQIQGLPPPLAAAGLHPKVALLLQPVVGKALEKSPMRRFQTAGELKDALERIERPIKLAWGKLTEEAQASAATPNRRLAATVTAVLIGICLAALMWAVFLYFQLKKFGLIQ